MQYRIRLICQYNTYKKVCLERSLNLITKTVLYSTYIVWCDLSPNRDAFGCSNLLYILHNQEILKYRLFLPNKVCWVRRISIFWANFKDQSIIDPQYLTEWYSQSHICIKTNLSNLPACVIKCNSVWMRILSYMVDYIEILHTSSFFFFVMQAWILVMCRKVQ